MWQRKQTIYLLVVTLLMGALAAYVPKNGIEGYILSRKLYASLALY